MIAVLVSFHLSLDKKGPIYGVEWSPTELQFCVVYGCILIEILSNITIFILSFG